MCTITICIYHTEINPDWRGDDNLSYIKVSKNVVEDYFYYNKSNDFHSKIGVSSFNNWLVECTADDTIGLWIFATDRDSVEAAYTPEGTIEFEESYCDKCECGFAHIKGKRICHRCGAEFNNTGSSFIDDEEKMIDFFLLERDAFLEFYSYLTELDYKLTCEDIIRRSKYWNVDWVEDNYPDMSGKELKNICLGIMITEWLGGKRHV